MADSRDEARPEDRPGGPTGGGPRGERPGGAGGPLARLFGIQLLAVLAITVVLTGIFALVKGGDDSTTTALDRSAVSATPSADASTTAAPPATTSAPATTSPAPAPTATAPAPSTSSRHGNRPEIVVFNQSAPGGSGDVAAQQLRDKGWTVFKVDDFSGNVSTTTVYYPAGLEKAAKRAARALSGDVRTREKFSNLSDTRLTLILTDDYGG
jgi:hypothetical protein